MSQKVHHCAFVSMTDSWDDRSTAKIRQYLTEFTNLTGKAVYAYSTGGGTWGDNMGYVLDSTIPGWELLPLLNDGTIKAICLIWNPMTGMSDYNTVKKIISGSEDAYIHQTAAQCKAFKYPVYMRPGGEWNLYGSSGQWAQTPADIIGAWRRIVDIFRAQGVTNVVWAWCPNSDDVGPHHWTEYYPGDGYVDMVMIDMYQYNNNSDPATLMSGIYNDYSSRKPIGIGEWGTNARDWTGSDTPDATRASFAKKFFDAVEARPAIKWINYWFVSNFRFNATSHPLMTAMYRGRIANSLYVSKDNGGGNMTTKVIKAVFSQILNIISLIISGQGTVTKSPDQPNGYTMGTVVTLTATPAAGWKFDNWEVDGAVVTANPTTVTM